MTRHNSSENLAAVETFFIALEQHDRDLLGPLLAPEVIEIIPFSNTGTPEPWVEFNGKEAVLGYLGTIITNFSRVVLTDKQFYVADDGNAIFLEAKGDLIQRSTSTPYRNVYVFKFLFDNRKIVHVPEYANPIPIAKLMGYAPWVKC